MNLRDKFDEKLDKLLNIYYSNPEITVHSTYTKIYYFYHLTCPGSLIIVFGTFWDPLTLRIQLLVTEKEPCIDLFIFKL